MNDTPHKPDEPGDADAANPPAPADEPVFFRDDEPQQPADDSMAATRTATGDSSGAIDAGSTLARRASRRGPVAALVFVLVLPLGWWAGSRLLPHFQSYLDGLIPSDPFEQATNDGVRPPAPSGFAAIQAARATANSALLNGDFPRVVAVLEPIIRDGHATTEDFRTRAQAWMRLTDLGDEPQETLKNAAQDFARAGADEEFAEAVSRLGRWLCHHGRPREAVSVIEQLMALKRTPAALLALSDAQAAAGQPDAARDTAEAALRLANESDEPDARKTAAQADHALAQALIRFADALEKLHPAAPEPVADADVKAEQHLLHAIAAAEQLGMTEAEAWRRELDHFRATPRVSSRAAARN